ncbi:hypothetical protein HK405_009932, partial [Cladochytrium tenue]
VRILAPAFSVPAFNEFSDDDAAPERAPAAGIVERARNYTVILINVRLKKTAPDSQRVEVSGWPGLRSLGELWDVPGVSGRKARGLDILHLVGVTRSGPFVLLTTSRPLLF